MTRVAWIVGASSGIGSAVASRLARDGRRLALSDEPATRMAEGLPSESWWGVCDVREAGVVMGFVTPEGVAEDVAMLASHHVTSLIDQDLLVDSGDVAVSLMLRGEDMERCVCHEIGTYRASESVLWR